MNIYFEATSSKNAHPVIKMMEFVSETGKKTIIDWTVLNSNHNNTTARWNAKAQGIKCNGQPIEEWGCEQLEHFFDTAELRRVFYDIPIDETQTLANSGFDLQGICFVNDEKMWNVPLSLGAIEISPQLTEAERLADSFKTLIDADDESTIEAFCETFLIEMGNDSDSPVRKARHIFRQYIDGSPETREAMNYLITTLCGWSLSTLLDKAAKVS